MRRTALWSALFSLACLTGARAEDVATSGSMGQDKDCKCDCSKQSTMK